MRRLITVRAREGIRFPVEGRPRLHIGPEQRQVARTPYYLRALRDGDLVLVEPPQAPAPPKAPATRTRLTPPTGEE